ncbi:retrovirus-related pol polyprotein from transposon TNT 1-94, partial [Tanacetum coccineum]
MSRLSLNIISIGLLKKMDTTTVSGNGLWKETLGSLIGQEEKGNTKLKHDSSEDTKSICSIEDNDDKTELWQTNLGKANKILLLRSFSFQNGNNLSGTFQIEHGIQHQKTPPKTPQLNGLAERLNRTLVERDRCLLSYAGLPASFWGFGAAKMFHTIIYEFFRCKASVHIPKDERSKLDVKGKPCVFLEYDQDEFGYRLYDPVQKKLVRSRDVVFEEDLTLKDVEKAERETIPQHNDDLIDLDPVPPKHFDSQFGDDIQNDEE